MIIKINSLLFHILIKNSYKSLKGLRTGKLFTDVKNLLHKETAGLPCLKTEKET